MLDSNLIAVERSQPGQTDRGLCRILLIGPYDPKCGEYTFLAPPLGVWRLAGALHSARSAQVEAEVFDPNCCDETPQQELAQLMKTFKPDVIGISTTGMTLQYDLELAHIVRLHAPAALILAGGMEATFKPEQMFHLGPFDLVVLGEGEKPLLEIASRWRQRASMEAIPGTAIATLNGTANGIANGIANGAANGMVRRFTGPALDADELRHAIDSIPYELMPYDKYWAKLEAAYAVGSLPYKADREARLSEIRSVRLITLNYCPMGCSFCSSTNFLHEAEGKVTKVTRLDAAECVRSIDQILRAQPETRTIIFQDDIFVFTKDDRILPLCQMIEDRKKDGSWPLNLKFISTNRIDAMTPERLRAMRRVGFSVLGFGVESFSLNILKEFNKRLIYKHIGPNLREVLAQGMTPFLDLIMSSPGCSLDDIASNIRHAYFWLERGCEIGMYPFVIPFSGSAMERDSELEEHYEWEHLSVQGTAISWDAPTRILPIDPSARQAMLRIEQQALAELAQLEREINHIPSRIRSLVWIKAGATVLQESGLVMPRLDHLFERLTTYCRGQEIKSEAAAIPEVADAGC